MTCTPQLKSTGIFRPKIKLQNNKQKVKLSNSGSGGANKSQGETCQGKRVRETARVAGPGADIHSAPSCQREPDSSEYQWPLQTWKPQKWRERTCTGWGNSHNTSGVVNQMEEKQKARREPESQPGQGRAVGRVVGEEQNIRCS